MRRGLIAIVVAVLASAWISAQEAGWRSYQLAPSEKGVAAGVSRYDVEQKGDQYKVRVMGTKGELQAEVRIGPGRMQDQEVEIKRPNGAALRISIGPEMKWAEVRDPANGAAGRAEYSAATGRFEKDATFVEFEKNRGADMRLALETLAQVTRQAQQP